MDKKLSITDQRMLKLMDHAVKVMHIAKSEWEYMERIGIAPTNLTNIKKARQRFSKDHIENACRLTGASADYIFGFTNTIMRKESKDPISVIRHALVALEGRNNTNNKFIKQRQKERF